MEFHQLLDTYTFEKGVPLDFKKKLPPDEFYTLMCGAQIIANNLQGLNQLQVERAWHKAKRPYYNLWPSIVPALLKVNLDKVMCDQLSIPMGLVSLTVNFAKDEELIIDNAFNSETDPEPRVPPNFVKVRSFMISRMGLTDPKDGIPSEPLKRIEFLRGHPDLLYQGFMILVDTGTLSEESGGPLFDFIKFRKMPGITVHQEIESLIGVHGFPESIVKLAVTVMLLENDPELITPDVLGDDRLRYFDAKASDELRQRLADKAQRRGKIGWDIGRVLHDRHEISPHYRNAYFSIHWVLPKRLDTNSSIPEKAVENHTGSHPNKRLVPRITWNKGSVVKRDKMLEMPTGYLGNNPDET